MKFVTLLLWSQGIYCHIIVLESRPSLYFIVTLLLWSRGLSTPRCIGFERTLKAITTTRRVYWYQSHFLVTLLLWSQGHHNHQKGLLVSITLSCHFIALESRPSQPPEGFTGINHTFLSLYCFGVKAITTTRRVYWHQRIYQ
jgi:hypothetical protein